ncbi:MAG TPA: 2-C-methyl-D-erythritol 2,4-cyclodiphosphate synthase [Actinomycetota bacterium]
MRIGTGVDAHPFAGGRPLVLGGVSIRHDEGLEGHSDADVLVHAIIDALLGAAGLGDLGGHFPAGDARFKGGDSITMLRTTAGLLAEAGYRIVNLDSVVIAQRPAVAPHRDPMCRRIAEALGIEPGRVSVKATTTDGMGFTGRGEGIAATAVALIDEA